MVKAEKGSLLHGLGHAVGKDRVSTQLIFSHLPGYREDVIEVITSGEQSGYYEMITPAPGCSLIIISNCPHLERWSVLLSLHYSLWEVSVPCHKDVISSVLSGIQSDCKVTAKRMA
jgi:hypothetical protein